MQDRDDTEELLQRWSESERRSRARRAAPVTRPRSSRWRAAVLVGALIGAGVWVNGEPSTSPNGGNVQRAGVSPAPVVEGAFASSEAAVPNGSATRNAWRFARRRGGQVSIAVIDTSGRLRGRATRRRYPAASVVKAMLLVAELRRLKREELELDNRTLELLRAMITLSDNDAAQVVYERVGDAGLRAVAAAAGMRDFRVAVSWGYAQVNAADVARLFARIRGLLPPRHRGIALGFLRSLTREQRWGLPRAARGAWKVHAKGGWRETGSGHLVHQGAWLRSGQREMSIAILTDGQPSHIYGVHTVRGIANRLLAFTP